MAISLEQLSREIGSARRELSVKNKTLQEGIASYDAKREEYDKLANELDESEEVSDEQKSKVTSLADELKKMRLSNISLQDQIQNDRSNLTDMEDDYKMRQGSNELENWLGESSGRITEEIGNDQSGSGASGASGNVRVLPLTDEQLDHDLSVYLHASIVSQTSRQTIGEVAAEFGNERVASASMTAGSHSSGGAWIHGAYSDRFIELLRPESIVRMMGVDEVPLDDGTMDIAKETGGPSGTYLGEDEDADVEMLTTGDIRLIAKEMVCIVAASDKLLRSRSAKAAERIRNSVIRGCGETENLYFLRGTAAGAGPTGMRYLSLASNIITANATVNLANVTADLGKLELGLLSNNVKVRKPAWIMSPRTLVYLTDLRDGNGNLAFPTLSSGDRPMLRRKPVYATTQIPENLGGSSNESEIMLVEASHLIIGDAPNLALDSSNTAAYNDGGTVKAAFSRRKTLVRLVMENDFNTMHAGAIAILTEVDWGA